MSPSFACFFEFLQLFGLIRIELRRGLPLGTFSYTSISRANPVLENIGKKYGKSVAQVALRWLIQRDVIIIPKSVHVERMQQNLDIFDFELSTEDREAIAALDTKQSLFFDHHSPEVVKMFMGWE